MSFFRALVACLGMLSGSLAVAGAVLHYVGNCSAGDKRLAPVAIGGACFVLCAAGILLRMCMRSWTMSQWQECALCILFVVLICAGLIVSSVTAAGGFSNLQPFATAIMAAGFFWGFGLSLLFDLARSAERCAKSDDRPREHKETIP
jgi:hypothetical protein